jgi:RHH-type rel operon transcriptional repressor/antitoxin RelB
MTTITARIPDALNTSLDKIAKEMERPKTFLIRKAIEQYILEIQDDLQDSEIALKRSRVLNRKLYTMDEVNKLLERNT